LGAPHDPTTRNPAFLAYLYARGFANDEYWSLYLEWVHSGREKPERLEELGLEFGRLKREFRERCRRSGRR